MSNICNNSSIQLIDINETIGQSLYTINSNFSILKNDVCQIDTNLQLLQEQYTLTNTIANSLSAQKNNIIKGKVSFDCTRNEAGILNTSATTRYIYPGTNFNITSVERLQSPDRYRINFQIPFSGLNSYGVFGTNSLTNNDAWVQPLPNGYSSANVTISILNTTGQYDHPEYVSIIII
jgi:hypothetical protein